MLLTDLSATLAAAPIVPTAPVDGNLPFYRPLGRTNLSVSCLGLGGGAGISSQDTLYAYDQGINYFFYSSDLHHAIYQPMAGALRQLCQRGARERENVVLATVTYIKSPEVAMAALIDQFNELQIDYIDVLFWGWIGAHDRGVFENCLSLSPDLRGPGSLYQRQMERLFGTSERLKKMGAVRYIGASFHELDLAQQWLDSPLLDVVMVRHNPSHRSAQTKVFSQLEGKPQRPGIVTFKSTGSHTGPLWSPPTNLPTRCWCPKVPDLYRYSLSQPHVDVCLTGLSQRWEIDAAIEGIGQGKLSEAELDYLALYGDLHRGRRQLLDDSPEQLIYRN
jgi:predicted aldo/keto reductase-like oxidoreductase